MTTPTPDGEMAPLSIFERHDVVRYLVAITADGEATVTQTADGR